MSSAPTSRKVASRPSRERILGDLRLAARKGDRAALSLALEEMRTLALSPRYWEKYLSLLGNPLARLVDLLVIKQGERIAHQKGWKISRAKPTPRAAAPREEPTPRRTRGAPRQISRRSSPRQRSSARRPFSAQPSLFD